MRGLFLFRSGADILFSVITKTRRVKLLGLLIRIHFQLIIFFTVDGNHLPQAAQTIIEQINVLSSPPTNGRDFLVTDVYGRGMHTVAGDAYVQSIFDDLRDLHYRDPARLNVAFADFSRIWDGVLGPDPGYEAFGYTSTESCVIGDGKSTVGSCDDPEHYFYWIPGWVPYTMAFPMKVTNEGTWIRHPSKETMRIMADYVVEVIDTCRTFWKALSNVSYFILFYFWGGHLE